MAQKSVGMPDIDAGRQVAVLNALDGYNQALGNPERESQAATDLYEATAHLFPKGTRLIVHQYRGRRRMIAIYADHGMPDKLGGDEDMPF